MKSIKELNESIVKGLVITKQRPEQLMDQETFNRAMLTKLNELCLVKSKGKHGLIINDENEWFFGCLFAYLNRNADDKLLTYSYKLGEMQINGILDLEKGLTLMGGYGIGKSLIMRLIHNNLIHLQLTGRFVTGRTIHECAVKDYDTIIGKDEFGCFIDDLGDEPAKSVDYGNEDSPVARTLKRKLDAWENLPKSPKLFITTNLSETKIIERYGGRIQSRLNQATNVLILPFRTDFRSVK